MATTYHSSLISHHFLLYSFMLYQSQPHVLPCTKFNDVVFLYTCCSLKPEWPSLPNSLGRLQFITQNSIETTPLLWNFPWSIFHSPISALLWAPGATLQAQPGAPLASSWVWPSRSPAGGEREENGVSVLPWPLPPRRGPRADGSPSCPPPSPWPLRLKDSHGTPAVTGPRTLHLLTSVPLLKAPKITPGGMRCLFPDTYDVLLEGPSCPPTGRM